MLCSTLLNENMQNMMYEFAVQIQILAELVWTAWKLILFFAIHYLATLIFPCTITFQVEIRLVSN